MPIYEYECRDCGSHHEHLQKVSDKPLTVCPACHRESLHRLISSAGFQLKGSGWYVTDFRDKKNATSQKQKAEEKPAEATTAPPDKNEKKADKKE